MLYFVIYLLVFYVSCSRSVTSVGEEKDNFSLFSLRTVLNRDKKLTPPTVGRQSADDRSIYRPIKCQILALFSSADKK